MAAARRDFHVIPLKPAKHLENVKQFFEAQADHTLGGGTSATQAAEVSPRALGGRRALSGLGILTMKPSFL